MYVENSEVCCILAVHEILMEKKKKTTQKLFSLELSLNLRSFVASCMSRTKFLLKSQNHDRTPEDGTAVLTTFFASCSDTDLGNLKCLCIFCFPDNSQVYLLSKCHVTR